MTFEAKTPADIDMMAAEFIKAAAGRRIFAFYAPMGAGKTTLISAIARRLGATEETGSPTFSIVNEYSSAEGEPIYHFDFYRIETDDEAIDLGLDEYFFSGNLCLIEWPEKVEGFLPDDCVDVELKVRPDGTRVLYVPDARQNA